MLEEGSDRSLLSVSVIQGRRRLGRENRGGEMIRGVRLGIRGGRENERGIESSLRR